ncbi:hypothetical protein D3C81_1982170 [compost metagenome]
MEIWFIMLATPPTMAMTEKVTLFTSRVVGLAKEPRNWDFTPASYRRLFFSWNCPIAWAS